MAGPHNARHTPSSGNRCASSVACQSWKGQAVRNTGLISGRFASDNVWPPPALYMSNLHQAPLEAYRGQQTSRAASRLQQAPLPACSKQPGRSLVPSAEYNYLDDTPEIFLKRTDVLLKLDDGSELPAHSLYLARSSKKCASMLEDDGPLSCASPSKKAYLPLPDCSRATAIKFMSVVYSTQQYDYLKRNRDSCMAVAGLAHKLDMEEIVRACDDVLSGVADAAESEGSQFMAPDYLRERPIEVFAQLMISALQYGMRKVVACCEYCIAYDESGKFRTMMQIIPSSSTECIMMCVRQAIYDKEVWIPEDFLSET